MNIDQLIRDLILEDQFKAKYTKTQRSIFCKNMYSKISTFLKNYDAEIVSTRSQLEDSRRQLLETKTYLEKYKIAYNLSVKRTKYVIILDTLFSITIIGAIIYFYYTLYTYFINSMQTGQLQKLP